jgi:hypothetical protein
LVADADGFGRFCNVKNALIARPWPQAFDHMTDNSFTDADMHGSFVLRAERKERLVQLMRDVHMRVSSERCTPLACRRLRDLSSLATIS